LAHFKNVLGTNRPLVLWAWSLCVLALLRPGLSRGREATADQLVVRQCCAAFGLGWLAWLVVVWLRCRVLARASVCRRATGRAESATTLVSVAPAPPLVLPIARGPNRVSLLVTPGSVARP
jgi:hypothetical protein